jgi:hypothetical protein
MSKREWTAAARSRLKPSFLVLALTVCCSGLFDPALMLVAVASSQTRGRGQNSSQPAATTTPTASPTPANSLTVNKSFLLQQVKQELDAAQPHVPESDYKQLQARYQVFSQELSSNAPGADAMVLSTSLSFISDIRRAVELAKPKPTVFAIAVDTFVGVLAIILLLILTAVLALFFKLGSLKRAFVVHDELFQGTISAQASATSTEVPPMGSERPADQALSDQASIEIAQKTYDLARETLKLTEALPVQIKEQLRDEVTAPPSGRESASITSRPRIDARKRPAPKKAEVENFLSRYPLSVADCLKMTATSRKERLNFISVQQRFESREDGPFMMIAIGENEDDPFMIPAMTRFETNESYYIPYKDYFDCDQPSSGEIIVNKPARLTRVAHGWKLAQKGTLAVQDYS